VQMSTSPAGHLRGGAGHLPFLNKTAGRLFHSPSKLPGLLAGSQVLSKGSLGLGMEGAGLSQSQLGALTAPSLPKICVVRRVWHRAMPATRQALMAFA